MGEWKSEADGSSFFISPNGKHSPLDELTATYKLLNEDPLRPWGYVQQPVICAFPTRKKFLEERLKIHFREVSCPDREEWNKPFQNTQFYLVYSNAFPNNPASMFGHTFVLLSKHTPPDSSEGLFDYAINFSADTAGSDEKSILYTIKGVIGGYPARYRLYPFYQMINLYVNWESRDLWYLKIPWKQDQIDRFLDHVWEVFTNTEFDYYFFDENCSYRLLAAMDYAEPGLNAVNSFYSRSPIYYVAPLSTYKYVSEYFQNRTEEFYTPALRKTLKNEISKLTKEERTSFDRYRKSTAQIGEETNVKVLDALITYFDYKKRTASDNYLSSQVIEDLARVLSRRSKISTPSPEVVPAPTPKSPLKSHSAHSLQLGFGQIDGKSAFRLGGKVAYHDILSPSDGFERWSHLNFLDTEISKTEDRFRVESFVPINIISFFPIDSYDSKVSWRAEAGYDQKFENYIRGGVGVSGEFANEKVLVYGFLSPIATSSQKLSSGRGYVVESEFGILNELTNFARIWIYYRDLMRAPEWNFNERLETLTLRTSIYISHDIEIRLETEADALNKSQRIMFHRNF